MKLQPEHVRWLAATAAACSAVPLQPGLQCQLPRFCLLLLVACNFQATLLSTAHVALQLASVQPAVEFMKSRKLMVLFMSFFRSIQMKVAPMPLCCNCNAIAATATSVLQLQCPVAANATPPLPLALQKAGIASSRGRRTGEAAQATWAPLCDTGYQWLATTT